MRRQGIPGVCWLLNGELLVIVGVFFCFCFPRVWAENLRTMNH